MIETINGIVEVECDICGCYEEFYVMEAADVIEHLKAAGWGIWRDDRDQWQHQCSCCRDADGSADLRTDEPQG